MDPWQITMTERSRHEDQYRTLGPNAMGMITGMQAKNFMMQSGLPPMVLAQVWGLSDVNGDGQMDFNEFSIACKLITNKLKGLELPKTLPPSMLTAFGGMQPNPMMQQAGMMRGGQMGMGMMPQTSMAPGMMGMGQPNMMGMGMPAQGMMPGQMAPGMMPGMMPQGAPGMMQQGAPGMMPANSMGAPGMMPANSMAAQGMMPANSMGAPGMMPMASNAGMVPATTGMAPVTQPTATSAPVTSGAATPPISMEWIIPMMTRNKYMATFQQTDRGRTGFLAGVQARNLLLQSGLPQNVLAQIWALSDIDNDGRLNTEEFILAGHLCDLGMKGEPMPATLPPLLIPPSMRKGAQAGTPLGPNASPASFEDKRKENFDKGQEVLEKRRQSLIEEQKKIEEERKRKEKEEAEAKEKQKREAERRRQAELERQLQKQREVEELRRQAEEKKRLARIEMEKARLKEWEESRKQELINHRSREDEKVLTLRARQEHLTKDVEELREKVTELTNNIADTRTGVTEVKTFIDGMRSGRDTKMADMKSLKQQLKDQNERLLKVTQEKAKMEAKNKARQSQVEEGREEELTEFEIKKMEKQKHVEELREKLRELKSKEELTKEKYEIEKASLEDHKEKLQLIIETCKSLYSEFNDTRIEIKAEKQKKIRELTDPSFHWDASPEQETAPAAPIENEPVKTTEDADFIQYKALYDYESENPDDLQFKAGDLITVHPDQPHEPGWLGGELDGKTGWFPEAYAEPVTAKEPEEATSTGDNADSNDSNMYVALFPYSSEEPGDLQFETGEKIEVVKKESEWWTGKIGDRMGVFPYNYVEAAPPEPKPEAEELAASVPETGPPSDIGSSSESDKKVKEPETENKEEGASWTGSASHVTHQVGVSEEVEEAAAKEEPEIERKSSLKNKVSFDQNEASKTPKERISFEKPADLFVTAAPAEDTVTETKAEQPEASAQPVVETKPEPKADASNTGTAKRKSKKKREESEGKSGKKPELATVIAPYTATGKEQLTLQKGQMILVRKKTETGWWQGEVQASGTGTMGKKKRQVGWFPASYVKLMGGPEKATPEPKKPQFRALYSYAGQHDDELAFNAGDIISLLSKDEEAWWKGELDGRSGVFPSNYVEEIN